jgi:squalene-hopene/tetraprenyl-beta-curcumene cyclase
MKKAEDTVKALSIFDKDLDSAVSRARDALLSHQRPEGFWCFPLEADCTIPAEYILMMHFMDEIDVDLERKMAVYLRERQGGHGGWPLFHGGKFDMSCTVKAYYALKLVGDSPDDQHMARAREAILNQGGAARSNVFTRITLALFGQIPWRGTPFIPVEIILMPNWFPFHIRKVSYWSRTVMVPLTVLCSLKPRAKNPRQVNIRELFTVPPEEEKNYFPIRSPLNHFFLALDKTGRSIEPFIPRAVRDYALKKAADWVTERINGHDGLGAIFPAMVNAHESMQLLGFPPDHPYRLQTKQALKDLVIEKGDSAYCQPCMSPVWDTALACLALQEEGDPVSRPKMFSALKWLKGKQVIDAPGDWRDSHPGAKGGGWAFQFNNPHYPDLDDTAVVAWAMHQSGVAEFAVAVETAAEWISLMQSRDGGFGAFDSDMTYYYLNEIPFADHGALLDPSTSDVSARCATLFACTGGREKELKACLEYLRKEQEPEGSWFGRWGTNYIYGTWSVITALSKAPDIRNEFHVRRAAAWLKRKQKPDGSWGECCETYFGTVRSGEGSAGTSFQTAWAMLGLINAGQGNSPEVRRGAQYLMETQRPDGTWDDNCFTAPGFPRVFYLKYHGYSLYFPLWALASYRSWRRNGQ